MQLQAELERIAQEIERHYATEYGCALDEESSNRRIRGELARLIIEAHDRCDCALQNEALALLAGTTGCAEDYLLFGEIADDLIARNILTTEEVDDLLQTSPAARWIG